MNVLHYVDPIEAARACGQRILDLLGEVLARKQQATLAVSGGSSPRPMFELFAKSRFPWDGVNIFWVDERCVPVTDPQSNFRMANEIWFAPAKVPAGNIHRVPTELEPHEAASKYADDLRTFLPFDVIHRGIGPDAHTASLFPGEPLIADQTGLAAAVWVEKMHQWRVTLLPGVLESAGHTVVLATGADKVAAVAAVLHGPHDPMKWPAQIGMRAANVDLYTDLPTD